MPGRGSAFCRARGPVQPLLASCGLRPNFWAVLKKDPPWLSGGLERPASTPLLRRIEAFPRLRCWTQQGGDCES